MSLFVGRCLVASISGFPVVCVYSGACFPPQCPRSAARWRAAAPRPPTASARAQFHARPSRESLVSSLERCRKPTAVRERHLVKGDCVCVLEIVILVTWTGLDVP